MDLTTRIIAQHKINDDALTGLERYTQITSLNIDGENNGLITIKGRIVLLTLTGVTMLIESKWSFVRYDRAETYKDVTVVDIAATYYIEGETMTDNTIALGGELKAAEVSHVEQQVDRTANNKYTALEQSPIGQGIKQMLGMDLANAISNGNWASDNLIQY